MAVKHTQSFAAGSFSTAEGPSLLAKAQGVLASAIRRLKEENTAHQAIWELEQLDDHALRDIGLNRCDIKTHVRGSHR
jgi:uncharacterized protein YjiS (DUF1127 family)